MKRQKKWIKEDRETKVKGSMALRFRSQSSISYLSRPKLTLPFSYSRFSLYHVSSFPLKSFLWIILFHIIIQSLCKYIFFFFELNLFVNIFSDKLIILSQPVFFMWEWKKKPECMTNLAVSKSYRINQ